MTTLRFETDSAVQVDTLYSTDDNGISEIKQAIEECRQHVELLRQGVESGQKGKEELLRCAAQSQASLELAEHLCSTAENVPEDDLFHYTNVVQNLRTTLDKLLLQLRTIQM